MKRLFSSFLVLLVFLNFVFIPVSASEIEKNNFINVLDYDFPNEETSTFVNNFNSGDLVRFDLPYKMTCGYVDIVILNFGSAFDKVECVLGTGSWTYELEAVSLGNNTWRLHGYVGRYASTYLSLKFNFTSTQYKGSISFLSFNVNQASTTSFPDVAGVWLSSLDSSYHYMSDPSSSLELDFPHYELDEISVVAADVFSSKITFPNWVKYDYVSFSLYLTVAEISSVACSIDGVDVPFSYTVVEPPADYNSAIYSPEADAAVVGAAARRYYVSIFVDLRNYERSGSFHIDLTGSYFKALAICSYRLDSVCGYVDSYNVNPVYYFLRNIWSSVKSGFSSIGSSLLNLKSQTVTNTNNLISAIKGDASSGDSYNDKVQSQVGDLENASNELNKLEKPDITGDVFDLSGEVNNSDILLLTSGIRAGLDVPLIRIIFVFALTFCLASFVLYGKK